MRCAALFVPASSALLCGRAAALSQQLRGGVGGDGGLRARIAALEGAPRQPRGGAMSLLLVISAGAEELAGVRATARGAIAARDKEIAALRSKK